MGARVEGWGECGGIELGVGGLGILDLNGGLGEHATGLGQGGGGDAGTAVIGGQGAAL